MEDALLQDGSSNKRTQTKSTHIFRREAYLDNTTKLRPAPNMFFKKPRFSTNSMWLIERPIFPVERRGEKGANTAADSDVCLVCLCVPSSSALSRDNKTRQDKRKEPHCSNSPGRDLSFHLFLFFNSRRYVLECCCCSCCCQNLGCKRVAIVANSVDFWTMFDAMKSHPWNLFHVCRWLMSKMRSWFPPTAAGKKDWSRGRNL